MSNEQVEIIAIGNEILLGDVLDTNTNWLCRRITGLGGLVRRSAIVRDELELIAGEIAGALSRDNRLVITTGGLGPTADDMTLAAAALAENRALEPHGEALRMVREKYLELAEKGFVDNAAITTEREKMAHLPRGAVPLFNPVGAAPGVVLETHDSLLVNLPGVPSELKGIFNDSLQPFLHEIFGKQAHVQLSVIADCGDESRLAPLLKKTADAHPKAYIKSRAKTFGPDINILVTFSATAASQDAARALAESALADFKNDLAAARINVRAIEE